MSPQPGTPFSRIFTIPISLYRSGMVMISSWEYPCLTSGEGATSVLQSVIWVSLKCHVEDS